MTVSGDRIEGVLPALVTPYGADGRVDLAMVRRLARHQLEAGCHGFFVCGSTGEGLFLSVEERKQVARAAIEETAGAAPVIVHVGAPSTAESVELARDAKAAGAAAVGSIPPIYYKVGLEGMMLHIRSIAEAAELPTYYYHIPQLTGVELSGDALVEAFLGVEGLVGLKYTAFDMFLIWWIIDASGGRLRVFNGADQMLFQGLTAGACGGIGSTYNYQTRHAVAVYEAFKAGDWQAAQAAQTRVNAVTRVLFRHGANIACEKAILALQGFDVGPPRAPMAPFPEAQIPALRRDLDGLGVLD